MITVSRACEIIREHFLKLSHQNFSMSHLNNHVLAEDLIAERDQPPFDRVAMDGIAVNWNGKNRTFKIEDIQAAGEPEKNLEHERACLEVMTGATLPAGTNTVIPYEVVNIEDGVASIANDLNVNYAQNIHFKGSDYKKGDVVLTKGARLHSPATAMVASQGKSTVKTLALPKIAIISTGDELVDPERPVEAHQIRRSNPYAIASEFFASGFPTENIELFHLNDDREEIYIGLKKILKDYQVLILSGGVSMGKFDHVHGLMGDLNITTHFHKIKQKPGKPMLFGTGENGQMVFGLPGNPVSALICLRRYVIEAFEEALGVQKQMFAILGEDVSFKKDMALFKSVTVEYAKDGRIMAHPVKSNGSGDFSSLAISDGFLQLPQDKQEYKRGDAFPLYLWKGR